MRLWCCAADCLSICLCVDVNELLLLFVVCCLCSVVFCVVCVVVCCVLFVVCMLQCAICLLLLPVVGCCWWSVVFGVL